MRRGDAGFTLVELVVAIVILGILIAPLAGSVILGFRANGATVDRLAESHDAQIAAAMFARDVQGATQVAAGGAAGSPACASTQPEAVDVVDLHQTSGDWLSYSYARVSNSPVSSGYGPTGDETVIVRTVCDASGTVQSTLTVVHLADSAPGHTPFAACNGGTSSSSCASATQPPASVELHYWDAAGNPYVLAGDTRATVASGTQPDALAGEMPALVLLGPDPAVGYATGGADTAGHALQIGIPDPAGPAGPGPGGPGSGDTTLTANRDVYIDGSAIMDSDAVFNLGSNALHVQAGCSPGLPQGCTTLATAAPDPMAPPRQPAVPGLTGCDPAHGATPCTVTTGDLTVKGGSLSPGVYTGHVTINPPGVTLNPGVYIFEGKLEIKGKAVVHGVPATPGSDTGVMLYLGCPAGASGCTSADSQLYVHQGGSLLLAPMMTGVYSSVVIYQDPADANVVSLSGGDLGTILPGIVYAPGAQVLVKNGSGNFFGAVIAQSAVFVGGTTTVGFSP